MTAVNTLKLNAKKHTGMTLGELTQYVARMHSMEVPDDTLVAVEVVPDIGRAMRGEGQVLRSILVKVD